RRHTGGAGPVRAGRGGQDPAGNRVRAPVRRRLPAGVVDRRRAAGADPRPARRAGRPTQPSRRADGGRHRRPAAGRAARLGPQAAAYLEQTDLPPADYLRRFREHRATLLARGDVVGYAGRVDTTWALSLERLNCEDPAAVQLLELAAFLAPDPIPLCLFGNHA